MEGGPSEIVTGVKCRGGGGLISRTDEESTISIGAVGRPSVRAYAERMSLVENDTIQLIAKRRNQGRQTARLK